jgi:hypothetical protein
VAACWETSFFVLRKDDQHDLLASMSGNDFGDLGIGDLPSKKKIKAPSQNVLAACSFKFVYVLSGWEGSASDSLVYQDARATDFQIPEGRYYPADASYPNTDGLLAPYRGLRYHLRE